MVDPISTRTDLIIWLLAVVACRWVAVDAERIMKFIAVPTNHQPKSTRVWIVRVVAAFVAFMQSLQLILHFLRR